MRELPISKGHVVLVDDEDYEALSVHRWQAMRHANCKSWYAYRITTVNQKRVAIYMHRQILGVTDPANEVDHRNGNGLDNRRSNLRIGTSNQNRFNVARYKSNTSGYKGVSRRSGTNRWSAAIKAYKQYFYLGSFASAEEAARAYDKAAREKHGEYAWTNFPD